MRIYVSIDMEGVAGVVHPEQVRRGGGDYEQARRWMTGEANAAIEGAFQQGATAVVVNDAHGDMRNLLLDEIDERAMVMAGSLKRGSMVAGSDDGFDLAFFLGYHAGAGTRHAILDHTYYGRAITEIRVGGEPFDEAAVNAAVCGEAGVPLGLLTGDGTVCARARERFGDIEVVDVKAPASRYAARTMMPSRARGLVKEAAGRAVARAASGAFEPFRLTLPVEVEVDFVNSGCADGAERVPGTRRTSGLTVAYRAADAATLLDVVQVWTVMAHSTLS